MSKLYSRREWLRRNAALGTFSAAHLLLPRWMPRLAFAPRHQTPRGDVLVCIFLRGGADSMNMIVPYAEDAYYTARPQLAIPRPDTNGSEPTALDLDGFFGIHPALAPLHELFLGNQLRAIHATGSPDPTRSHFEAMDFMERGTPGDKTETTGWLGRHLATLDTGNTSPVRAVGWGTAAQMSLAGPVTPTVLQSIADFHLGGRLDVAAQMMASISQLYSLETDALAASADATLEAIELVEQIQIEQYRPQNSASYPENEFAMALMQTAALIRADLGLETACIDLGGWDTHARQGGVEGSHAQLLNMLATGLAAFHQDMGTEMSDVTLVVMSEFGRRLHENADQGTDHGHGGAMLVMSGHLVEAEPVLANWPGLLPENLVRGDLAITTDYRNVLSEILTKRLNNPRTDDVFPNFSADGVGLF